MQEQPSRDVVRIPIRRRDGSIRAITLIDGQDAQLASRSWSLTAKGYVMTQIGGRKDRRTYFLHRMIMGLDFGDGLTVDHINGDKLDNRRANLRVLTMAENAENTPGRSGGLSKYRGVTRSHSKRRPWLAQVHFRGRWHYGGMFESEEAAAAAARALRAEVMQYANEDRSVAAS